VACICIDLNQVRPIDRKTLTRPLGDEWSSVRCIAFVGIFLFLLSLILDLMARVSAAPGLYIPLPDAAARCTIIKNLLRDNKYSLSDAELDVIVERTDGYSGSDLKALCVDAGLGMRVGLFALKCVMFFECEFHDTWFQCRLAGPMRGQSNIDDMDEMDVRFVAVSMLFSFGLDDTHSDACLS
jgi:hypothetical protein